MDEFALNGIPWYSLHWFSWNTLQQLVWGRPYVLYLLPVVPLFFAVRSLLFFRHRQKVEIAFFDITKAYSLTAWLRHFPKLVYSGFIILLLLAVARPFQEDEMSEFADAGLNIVLAIDISESMQMEDFEPNRLEAAKTLAHQFVDMRPADRLGLVVFAGEAFALCPLTGDHAVVKDFISEIDFNLIDKPATAIGSALATGINRLRDAPTGDKLLLLITDGDNTAGNLDPLLAAKLAAAFKIRCYTIAVGKEGPVPYGKDAMGRPLLVENTIDFSTLKEIASVTGGNFYRAEDQAELAATFQDIDKLEKTQVVTNVFRRKQDAYHIYLLWALVLFGFWLGLKSTFMVNALED